MPKPAFLFLFLHPPSPLTAYHPTHSVLSHEDLNLAEAVKELGIADPVQKVSDIQEMLSYGIMSMPALVVDGKVKFSGRVPGKDEIKKYL